MSMYNDPRLEDRADLTFGPVSYSRYSEAFLDRATLEDLRRIVKSHQQWMIEARAHLDRMHESVDERDATIARLSRQLADANLQIAALAKESR
jgi:uncharacterized coiled-coil protein SlyX